MSEKLRLALVKVLLVCATFAAVMGYNFTRNPVFIALPFVAGVILFILVRRRLTAGVGGHADERARRRRQGMVQILISCLMVTGFIVYSSIEAQWNRVTGFGIMLSTLVVLEVLACLLYRYGPMRDTEAERRAEASSCEELRRATGIHGEERR